MNNTQEEIFNQALEKLRAGFTVEQVLSMWPNSGNELAPLLMVAQNLLAIPKLEVPEPAMQRKYILMPMRRAWLSWLPVSRFATLSTSLVLLITALVGTAYVTKNSTAGQPLFGLKKTAEQVELAFATTPQAKANLQVAITQQRLSEAQAVFQDPGSDTTEKKAVLNELFSETASSIDAVNSAAQSNALSSSTPPIVASLASITRQQQALVNQITPADQAAVAATNAVATTQDNSDKVDAIKQYIQVASNAQALAKLSPNPNVVTISGSLNKIGKNSITVEKTVFAVNASTSIEDIYGNATTTGALAINTKVTVIGNQDDKGNITARQISMVDDTDGSATGTGQVQGDSTSTPSISAQTASSTPLTASSTTQSDKKSIKSDSNPSATSTTDQSNQDQDSQPNPNTATGSFILESPAQ